MALMNLFVFGAAFRRAADEACAGICPTTCSQEVFLCCQHLWRHGACIGDQKANLPSLTLFDSNLVGISNCLMSVAANK
jgi:hypothetical protein